MGTKFKDFPASGIDSLIQDAPPSGHAQADSDEAEKLIDDGNVHVLTDFESQRKREDYSRSQTSRCKKELSLNVNTVDWSGFPGAAHKKSKSSGDKEQRKKAKEGEGAVLASTAKLDKRKQAGERPQSMSPGRSLVSRHRSRRHMLSTGATLPLVESEAAGNDKKSKPPTIESPRKRTEGGNLGRGNLGSHPSSRRANNLGLGRSKSQSKGVTRRPRAETQMRSLSPSSNLHRRNNRSSSPSASLRRTVVAAASATTLDVSGDTPRSGSISSRNSSRGKRKTKEKKSTTEEDTARFHHGASLKW